MKDQIKKILLFTYLFAFSFAANAQITSTFDTDADGWTFLDSSTPITVSHQTSNGNPGGFASVTYSSSISTTTESWFAPEKFLGNLVVRSLGRNLRFDLQQSIAGTGSNAGIAEIRIERGGDVLIYQLPAKPALAPLWSSYSIKLDETGGWLWSSTSGSAATRSQIIYILTNVTSIEIRGTYGTNASYTSGLDNVIIEQNTLQPAPTISSLSASSGNAGTSIVINGSGFNTTPENNAVYFSGVTAPITSASATQLAVSVPSGARYGSITVINKVTGLSTNSKEPFVPTFSGGGRIIPASFKPKVDFLLDATAGNDVNGIRVADLDGDGWNDIIATEQTPASVSIFRNLGTGGDVSTTSFSSKIVLAGAGSSSGLFIVDIDGDGKHDIVAANSATFVTFRNTSTPGNIIFEAAETWSMSNSGALSNVIDVDGDGRPELIGQHGNGSVAVDFWIIQNISSPGDIVFASSVSYFGGATLDAGAGVAAGDLDNDGKPELLVSHGFGDRFSILQNNSVPGTISLTNLGAIVTGQYNRGLSIADFNLDGKNDIVWKRSGNSGIYIRLNSNSGGGLALTDFANEVILTGDLSTYGGMSIADINGDGKPDITASDNADLGVYENVYTGGVFNATAFIPAYQHQGNGNSTYPTSPVVADLNGDGKPEMLAGITNTSPVRISVYENKNVSAPVISVNTVSPLAAEVGATVTITGSNFSTVASENEVYFGAMQASVLSASETEIKVIVPAGATYAPVSVRKGELYSRYRLPFVTTFSAGVTFDNTHFAPPVNFTLANANYDIEVGDLNRDGLPDILTEANGGFAFRNTHLAGAINTGSLLPDDTLSVNSFINPRIEDFDGDGLLDVASVNGLAHRNISTSAEISFEPSINTGLGASNMDVADFNNDGKTDLAVTADLSGAGDLVIKENRSNAGVFSTGTYGTFSGNFVYNKPAATGGLVTEDFDGNGFADLVTTNPGADNISIYRNLGVLKISAAQFDARIDIAVGDNPSRIYKGDFDNDGKLDLLLYHSTGTTPTLLTILQNTSTLGNISFSRVDLTNPSATTVAAIADLDGDGKPEIITTSETGNRFSIFKNIHTGGALSAASFASPFNTTVTSPRGLATGDLNLDGKPEIIITRAAGLLVVYENLISDPVATLTVTQQPVNPNNICEGSNFVFSTDAAGTTNISFQWQKLNINTGLFENLSNDATYSGVNTKNLSITNATTAAAGDYRCMINGDFATTVYCNTGTLTVNTKPADPVVNNAERCGTGSVTLSATGGAPGEFIWRLDPNSGEPIQNENDPTYTTPDLTVTTTYYVAVANSFCESNYVAVTATVNTTPSAPTVTPASICGSGNIVLAASGGTDGQYRWYDAPTGGSEITGEVNSTYTTPSITATKTYYVSINNGKCESARTPVTATVLSAPSKPIITASETIIAGVVTLCFQPITLSAPAGFATYTWSTGQTTQQITTTQTGSYTVTVKDQNGCASPTSDAVQIVNSTSCVNNPPVINSTSVQTVIGGRVTVDLSDLISDPDDNLDPASLVIVGNGTQKGGTTTLSGFTLEIDYANAKFSGNDLVTIRVCDLLNVCFETALQIEVIGDIVVYNGISPNGDTKNDTWVIEYITLFPDTQTNQVSIYNRWGDLLWEGRNYDNSSVVFSGLNKNGNELATGTYFYKIEFESGRKTISGYLSLKR